MHPHTNTPPRLLAPFSDKPRQAGPDWQYRNPLAALFPLSNFSSDMSSPYHAVGIPVISLLSLLN